MLANLVCKLGRESLGERYDLEHRRAHYRVTASRDDTICFFDARISERVFQLEKWETMLNERGTCS